MKDLDDNKQPSEECNWNTVHRMNKRKNKPNIQRNTQVVRGLNNLFSSNPHSNNIDGKDKEHKGDTQRKKEEQEVLKDPINIMLLQLVAKFCFCF